MKALAAVCFGLAAAVLCTNARAQDPAPDTSTCEFCDFGKTLVVDTRDVFTAPVRWEAHDWGSVAWKSALVVGSVALLDEPVHDYLARQRNDTSQRIADAFEPFGAEYALGTLAGFAIVGAFGDHPTARSVARDGTVSTLITSGLIVPVLKHLAGRSRPNADQGAHDWHPLNGGESFPSGHTAEAFTIAASIAENYHRPWITGLTYSIAGLVGYARMEHEAHWLSDVTAGAFIGIGVAKQVSKLERTHKGIAFAPLEERGMTGIRITKSF